MAVCPYASLRKISRHFKAGAMDADIHGLVIHITDPATPLTGLFDLFNKPSPQIERQPNLQVSAHFGISKDGEIWQFVDTSDVAFAIDGSQNDAHWISVENSATFPEMLTGSQLQSVAVLLAWLNDTYAVPFQLANQASDYGLGFHRMFHIGDHACPGPAVVAQRSKILKFAFDMRGNNAVAPPNLLGRWEVSINAFAWIYNFHADNTVGYGDIIDRSIVKGVGSWVIGKAFSGRDVVKINWRTGASEEWDLPIKFREQTGMLMDDLSLIKAQKIH
jgi:N-acetylmuramoyl-L-alanine amidase